MAEASDSPFIIVGMWVAGALIVALTAFAFAELAAAIPRAGGPYDYVERSMGEQPGIAVAFVLLMSTISTAAMLCFVVGEYLVRLGVGGGQLSASSLAIMSLVLFVAVNATGTKLSGMTQILFSTAKGLVLLGLVVALFGGEPAPPVESVAPLRDGWLPVGTAMLVIFGTYGGWWNVVVYAEEIRDPRREVPRSLFGGILAVAIIYVLINLAMLHILTPDEMAGSNFVAADAAGKVFGERGDTILTLFGVLSVGAIANLFLMTGPRSMFALARAGILPRPLAHINKRGTPIIALLSLAIGGGFLILTDSYLALSSMSVTLDQMAIVLVIVSLLALRRREPELERPYRAPLYPWPVLAALAINVALLIVFIVQDPFYSLSGLVVVAVLWALFYVLVSRPRRTKRAAIGEGE